MAGCKQGLVELLPSTTTKQEPKETDNFKRCVIYMLLCALLTKYHCLYVTYFKAKLKACLDMSWL